MFRPACDPRGVWRHTGAALALVGCAVVTGYPGTSYPQGGASAAAGAKAVPAEHGVRWRELKPAQQAMLKPLEQEWAGIDAPRKQKWLELAAAFPKLSVAEQARVQTRMVEWAQLTPQQRGQARINFQEAKHLPAQDRQARWEAYQALPMEQQRQLAARAAPSASNVAVQRARKAEIPATRSSGGEAPQAKSNIVPNPALAAQPRAVSPLVVQAGPGATTTMMTKRPAPPSHQQSGLPKIAATPEFVNKTTLLPQRGPQGAATRPVPAAESAASKQP